MNSKLKRAQGRSIRTEIIFISALSICIIATLAGTAAYQLLKQQQIQQTLQTQRSLANQRTAQIENYMNNQIQHLVENSQSSDIALAMQQLEISFQQGSDSVLYQTMDASFHARFQAIKERWNYSDIFLINRSGDIIFTMLHESDFGTNLQTGPYHNTALAQAYSNALLLLSPVQSSFAYYQPSDEPAAFIAAPIIQHGKLLGILAFQLNTDAFYTVAGNLSGLGKSGETILGIDTGDTVLITAPTRHNPDAAFKLTIPRSNALAQPIKDATQGKTGQGVMFDLRNIKVIAAWAYIPSLQWGLVSKIDQDEALESLIDIRNKLILTIAAILLLLLVGVAWSANRIIQPLAHLTRSVANMGKGSRFEIDTPTDTSMVEINLLSDAFNQMSQKILGNQDELETKVKERTAELSRLQAAIDQTNDIVLITDRDAIIEYVNPAFEKISGYSAKEAIGRRSNLVKSGEMPQQFYRDMWDTILAGHNWQSDFINRNKAGELFEVEQAISPIKNEHGNITGFVSVQRDVTKERQQQQQLEHTQRLESLGVLAGGIAHDFNNLLTTILGNSGLALRRIPEGEPLAKYLHQIEQASEHAAELCNQMLAYSGKGKFVVTPVNLSQLINSNLELLQVSINKNVSLQSELSQQLPDIEADKAQMQQVIMNLIINASEAIGDENGHIMIQTGTIEADANYLKHAYLDESLPAGKYVFLEITDNGCGMDKETLTKLYDPFFTTKFSGRGLGMSAILGIVRGHHGAIHVYSEPDKGTTFKLLFPVLAKRGTEIEGVKQPDKIAWQGEGRILVVDDEDQVRRTVKMMLEDIGFEVITAVDGLDAVKIFSQEWQHIDAVLLDMTMPNMDGKAAFREIRKIDPNARVILSSGYNEQEATRHFTGKGLAGFLQKPYQLKTLWQKLQELFQSD